MDTDSVSDRSDEDYKNRSISLSLKRHGSHSPHSRRHRSTSPSKSKNRSKNRCSRRGDKCLQSRTNIERRYEYRNRFESRGRSDVKSDNKERLGGKAREKLSVLAKLGIELKLPEQSKKTKLWTKDKSESEATWKTASFSDCKLTAKFQRLMGIKKGSEDAAETSKSTVQDQELLFKRMEEEYEVARHTTHTLRGAGLGFSK